MNYVYIQTEPQLWTVGFYTPDGKWVPESDWSTPEEAAQRVRFLNGGRCEDPIEEVLNQLARWLADPQHDCLRARGDKRWRIVEEAYALLTEAKKIIK